MVVVTPSKQSLPCDARLYTSRHSSSGVHHEYTRNSGLYCFMNLTKLNFDKNVMELLDFLIISNTLWFVHISDHAIKLTVQQNYSMQHGMDLQGHKRVTSQRPYALKPRVHCAVHLSPAESVAQASGV